LKGILDRIEPPPIHEPLPEPKRYEPPRFNREGAVMGEVGTGSADDAGRRGRRHALVWATAPGRRRCRSTGRFPTRCG
jgi:hypothetical protein